jgi:hypothetical protein
MMLPLTTTVQKTGQSFEVGDSVQIFGGSYIGSWIFYISQFVEVIEREEFVVRRGKMMLSSYL